MSINLLRHASAACVISIIIDGLLCRSCTPKEIDLQAFFVTTASLLCQRVVVNKQSGAAQYKRRYHLAPPQSILTKQM